MNWRRKIGQPVLVLWITFVAFAVAYQWYVGPPLDFVTLLFCAALVSGAIGLAVTLGIIDVDARD